MLQNRIHLNIKQKLLSALFYQFGDKEDDLNDISSNIMMLKQNHFNI